MTDSRRLPPDAIVDAHHHLWHRSQRPQPWIDPKTMAAIDRDFDVADLASAARAAGVAQTVLVQSTASTGETIDLLDIAADSNLIGGVVGWVDLSAENVAERLDQLLTAPGGDQLVGIRHTVQDEPDPAFLDRTDIRRGIAAVRDAGLVFDLLIRDHQLPAAARLVRDLPSVAFVLDHLAKPALAHGELDGWARNLSSLARLPNVAAKLSGLATEATWTSWKPADLRPAVLHALVTFGPQRLMFGSDWPVCLLASSYERWVRHARRASVRP
jgi:L-fuconolactonase